MKERLGLKDISSSGYILTEVQDIKFMGRRKVTGAPVPTQTPKLLRFVDTTEMTRGPQDSPGYWMVSGARLFVENGKITLRVKYSLFVFYHDEEAASF
ncbi:MACPF domain-containing protein [Senna tora]|uniref:MACPF domain-containing protein n=1 Tax=Senna tora TaxID=362788 RepID=A0A835CHF0_9FABA|nr:MACPF domain-containing protein [Senna tora]